MRRLADVYVRVYFWLVTEHLNLIDPHSSRSGRLHIEYVLVRSLCDVNTGL